MSGKILDVVGGRLLVEVASDHEGDEARRLSTALETIGVLREEVATLRAMLEPCVVHGVGPGEPCRWSAGRACAARRARVKGPGL